MGNKFITTAEILEMNERMASLYPERVVIGRLDGDHLTCKMRRPKIDCDWYWGFGYIGHRDMHTHFDSLHHVTGKRECNIYDSLMESFGDTLTIPKQNLWAFAEVVTTVYRLRDMADTMYHGGSNLTQNPGSDVLVDGEIYRKVMLELIPNQIAHMYRLLGK